MTVYCGGKKRGARHGMVGGSMTFCSGTKNFVEKNFSMGCISSRIAPSFKYTEDDSTTVVFKMMSTPTDAEQSLESLSTGNINVTDALLAVTVLLAEPIGCQYFVEYLDTINSASMYHLWVNMEEYKLYNNQQSMFVKACHIYDQFFENRNALTSKVILKEEYNKISNICGVKDRNSVKKDIESDKCDATLFENVTKRCLVMLSEYYMSFILSVQYQKMNELVQKKYNRVQINDFVYYSVIGRGGYGLVLHCKKKSTGIHYAMKIQPKSELRLANEAEPWKVCSEMSTFACCKHPYIVELSYAFQSSKFAMMVLSLGTCGSLGDYLYTHGVVSEDLVGFYAAELVSVLGYLHSKGLIYRDLKPGNILLNADGHIQLVDFGTVSDVQGHVYSIFNDTDLMSPFMTNIQPEEQLSIRSNITSSESDDNFLKTKSVVGTVKYMAPEMFSLLCAQEGMFSSDYLFKDEASSASYSFSIDWWSLGATMYRLLTGKYVTKTDTARVYLKHPTPELLELVLSEMKDIDYGPFRTNYPLLNVLQGLLTINPLERLGSGAGGIQDIKNHEYFKGVNWELVDRKGVVPFYVPKANAHVPSQKKHKNAWKYHMGKLFMFKKEYQLHELIILAGKRKWLEDTTTHENDDFLMRDDEIFKKYFDKWNYISRDALEKECAMQQQKKKT